MEFCTEYICEMLRKISLFLWWMPTTLNNQQREAGQCEPFYLCVKTHEGAIVSANQTSRGSLLELDSYSEDIKRLRDIFGMNHHESIYVSDA